MKAGPFLSPSPAWSGEGAGGEGGLLRRSRRATALIFRAVSGPISAMEAKPKQVPKGPTVDESTSVRLLACAVLTFVPSSR